VALGTLSLVGAPCVEAQATSMQVEQFTVDKGLAVNNVRGVAQDRAGFIWVATLRGLQRFDRYSWVPYAALNPSAPPEISAAPIQALRADTQGTFWIQTDRETFHLDPISMLVERAPNGASVTSAAWTATRTEDGLDLRRSDPAATHLLRTEWFDAVLEHGRARVWLWGVGGLAVLDPESGAFRRLPGLHERVVSLKAAGPDRVLALTDRWFALVDTAGRIVERWSPPELGRYLPTDILLDREGGFWVGTVTGGLFRFDINRSAFEHVSSATNARLARESDFVMAIAERRDRTLWVGSFHGGAYRVDANERVSVFRHDPRDTRSLASDQVWDIAQDGADSLWIATTRGLCRVEHPGFRCVRLPQDRVPVDLARTPDGGFWIAAAVGGDTRVLHFDPVAGTFTTVMTAPMQLVVLLHWDEESGHLWLGGDGMYRVRLADGRAVDAPLRAHERLSGLSPAYALHRDTRGVLWLASGLGLERWDTAGRFVPVASSDLRATPVFSIAEDTQGRLWLGTGAGLVQYAPLTGATRRYTRRDGVRNEEFNRRAALRRRSGDMLFGGVEGLTTVRAAVATADGSAPVVMTRTRKVAREGFVDTPVIGEPGVMRLAPGDRALTLEFAALTFAAGPAPRYRYRLEGLSDAWIETNDHTVTYPTPQPGRYVFRVQASTGPEGSWSPASASLVLQVVPPVWRTSWFRATIFLLFLVALWLLHRLRMRRVLAIERLRLRIAHDLHDEIGAGLSSIALISDGVGGRGNHSMTDHDRAQLQRIARSARDMVGDLREIVWAIDPGSDRIDDVVGRMRDVASELLGDVAVEFRCPPAGQLSTQVGMAVRRDLLRLYKELLHNVARHSRATSVTIALDAADDRLVLVVADDGIGFDPGAERPGTGFRSLRERARRLGAVLEVESTPGAGTTARLSVPTT
jgi:signal transduction histidine kinase